MENFNQIILEAVKLALAGIIGGLIGARANDRFTRSRDASPRKRAFVGFLKGWKSEIFSAVIHGIWPPSENAYRLKLASFLAEVEQVRDVFRDRQRFDDMTKRVAGLTEKDWYRKQPRDVICGAIDALITFCS